MQPLAGMLKASLIVSICAFFGSAISFLNQVILAWAFGAGPNMDSYLLAISVPSTFAGLATGILGYQLVPALQKEQAVTGAAGVLLRGLALVIGFSSVLLATAGGMLADLFLSLMAPNLPWAQHELTIGLTRVAWVGMPLAVLGAVYTAGMHISGRFYLVAILQSAPIVGALGFLLLFRRPMGVYAPVVGQVFGYAGAAIILHIYSDIRAPGAFPVSKIRHIVRQSPLALAAIAVFVLYPLSDAVWGVRVGPAAVSHLGYAQRLLVGFSGIVVVGATTVLFPKFSEMAALGDIFGMLQTLGQSMRAMLVCMAPAAAFVAGSASPVIGILFERGSFGPKDVDAISAILPAMLGGMVGMSCGGLVFKALFASGRIVPAALISSLGSLIYFACSGWLGSLYGLLGIAAAYALTWWIVLIVGVLVLWPRASWLAGSKRTAGFLLRLAFACALVGGIGVGCTRAYVSIGAPTGAVGLVFISVAGASAMVVYLAVSAGALQMAEPRLFIKYSMRRITGPYRAAKSGSV